MPDRKRFVMVLAACVVAIIVFAIGRGFVFRFSKSPQSDASSDNTDLFGTVRRMVPELFSEEGQPLRLDEYVAYIDQADDSILPALQQIVTVPWISDDEKDMVFNSLQYCFRDFRSLTRFAIELVSRSKRKHGAIQFLGRHGTAEAIPTLESLMYGTDAAVCFTAVRALAELDPDRAVKIIEKWYASDAFVNHPHFNNTVANERVELILDRDGK